MSQFWKQARSDSSWQRQWERRLAREAPFIVSEIHRRMVQRTEILRLPEGAVCLEGWLHPEVFAVNPLAHLQKPILGPVSTRSLSVFQGEATRGRKFLKGLLGRFSESAGKSEAIQWLDAEKAEGQPARHAMVWSPLRLQSVEEPKAAIQGWFDRLVRGGAMFFSCLGPDSGLEIKAAVEALGIDFPDFADMHDWGDLLLEGGFSDPVMEMEKITLSYADAASLLRDWRAAFGNPLAGRRQGLAGRGFKDQLLQVLANGRRDREGRLLLTVEVIYGHAWKVKTTLEPGVTAIPLDQIKGRKA